MNVRQPLTSLLVPVLLLSTAVALSSAHAANRAFPGSMGKAARPSEEHCLSTTYGWLYHSMDTGCPSRVQVLLPMSVDNAAMYSLSVYGHQSPYDTSTACRSVRISRNFEYSPGYWKGFVYADWRPEQIVLDSKPVNAPGDALYIECMLAPYAAIITYGWN